MLILVSYDVTDDRRRTKLAHRLGDFGHRVQYSVFECRLEASEVEGLEKAAARFIDLKTDSVRIYALCGHCAPKVRIIGPGEVSEDPEVYVL